MNPTVRTSSWSHTATRACRTGSTPVGTGWAPSSGATCCPTATPRWPSARSSRSTACADSSFRREPGRDRSTELPARVEVGTGRLADHRDRGLHGAPPQAGGDHLDRAPRPVGVVVAVDVQPERAPDGRLEARVVDLVEEVLERA